MFSKAKYEYIKYLLDSSQNHNESLEKKATFLFSIISIFIGGVFFQFEKIALAINYLNGKNLYLKIIIFSGAAATLLGISIASYFVLNSIKMRKFFVYWPVNPVTTLFSPESNFFLKKDSEDDFYEEMGDFLIGRLEYNHVILQKKAKNIQNAWVCLVFTLFLLVSIAVLFTFTINN